MALKNDGSVVAWGDDFDGQTTVPLAALSGVIAIAAGAFHTVALKNDGTVLAWGAVNSEDDYGQTEAPLGLSGVTAISAGGVHTLALLGTAPLLPTLKAQPTGNQLILTWPTNAAGFTLQSTLNLTPPVTWTDATNPPAVVGPQFTVTNSLSGSARFYRLRQP